MADTLPEQTSFPFSFFNPLSIIPMNYAHTIICETSIDGKTVKDFKLQVITPFSCKPTEFEVQKALQEMFPGKRIGGVHNHKLV
jgi:hypothetical protein